LGESQPVWWILTQLSRLLGRDICMDTHEEALQALSRGVSFYQNVTWEAVGSEGMMLKPIRLFIKQAG
ncbi:MAG: hypothetical protein ACK4OO_08295, partial [bacterium]